MPLVFLEIERAAWVQGLEIMIQVFRIFEGFKGMLLTREETRVRVWLMLDVGRWMVGGVGFAGR
jgi:hypothetical protein